ncbi:MAG: hypothetical protein ACI8VC_002590 [Candidatus Endobugula sp.]|jgi:hypothetical protein
MTGGNVTSNAMYSVILYASALILIVIGITNTWVISAVCLPVSLVFLYLGYVLNRSRKISVLNKFRFFNAISITYIYLLFFFIFIYVWLLTSSSLMEYMSYMIIGPYTLDYNQLCCVNETANFYIRVIFFLITCVGLLSFILAGLLIRNGQNM